MQPKVGMGEMLKEEQYYPLQRLASSDNFEQHPAWARVGRQPLCGMGRGSLRCSKSWVVFLWKPFPLAKDPLLESHFFGLNVDLCYKAESLLTEKKE